MIEFITNFFHVIIYDPLYNLLIIVYNLVPYKDFGLAIVLVTVLIKLVLAPIFRKQIESQKRLQELQPKIKEIQNKYKDDKEKQTKAIMEFYKENKVNPFSGCMPLVLQLFIFIAFYRVIIAFVDSSFLTNEDILYNFVSNPGQLPYENSFGVINLMEANKYLAVLAAVAMYFQSKMMMQKNADKKVEGEKGIAKKDEEGDKKPDFAQMMQKQMLYVGPLITLVIGWTFAAGLTLYWFASILFSIAQQFYIQRNKDK